MFNKKVYYIGLSTFCKSGGIEKVNKCWLKALDTLSDTNELDLKAAILMDSEPDENYINRKRFKGYKGNKITFFITALFNSFRSDVVICSHINLAPILVIIKLFRPKTKIYLYAHGIEVWRPLGWMKKEALLKVDCVLAVSSFTKQELIAKHNIVQKKIEVLPNALDPFFTLPPVFDKSIDLLERYEVPKTNKILFTLARLSSQERYKGYDQVIKVIPKLLKSFPNLSYLIAGKADLKEYNRLIALIKELQVENHVKLIGFVKESELSQHYLLGDVFVMPSEGEGFGISFIEATACGRPALGGNGDGSSQAIIEGLTGLLCNPKEEEDVLEKIINLLHFNLQAKEIQAHTLNSFTFDVYHKKIQDILQN